MRCPPKRVKSSAVNDRAPNAYVTIEGAVVIYRDNPNVLHGRMFSYHPRRDTPGYIERSQ